MQIDHYWIDIENAAGDLQGGGPLSPSYYEISRELSRSGAYSFGVSPGDPNIDALALKLIAVCRYVDTAGNTQIAGSGIIDDIETIATDTGAIEIVVSGSDISRDLVGRSVRQLSIGDAGGGDNDAPDQIIALAPAGWSMTDGTTAADVYLALDGQSVLNALITVGDGIGEHFRLGSGKEIVWLGPESAFDASGVRAVRDILDPDAALGVPEVALISSLREVKESVDLVTRVYCRGAGNGDAILRLLSYTGTPPTGYTVDTAEGYVEDDAAVSAYGVIEREIDFKNLSPIGNSQADKELAAEMLVKATVEYLRRWSTPQRFYEIELAKVDQVLQPGSTIRVVYYRAIGDVVIFDLDEDLNIMSVDDRLDESGLNTVGVRVSTTDRLPMTDQEMQIKSLEKAEAYTTHAQLNANARVIDSQGSIDDAHPLDVAFWLGEEVVSVKNVKLRFRVDPLRSTVKSIGGSSTSTGSGGSSTPTTSSGGSSTPTTSSGGSSTPTSGTQSANHSHGVNVGSNAIVNNLGIDAFGALTAGGAGGFTGSWLQNNSNNHTHDVTIPNHTHSVTIPNHTHSVTISNHTHSVTAAISTLYGVFEDSGANTLAYTDLVIKVNGVTFVGSITSIGGGWYEAEITDELVESDYTPSQKANVVEYSTAVSKTARITTSLSIVDIVQAVSIL